MVMSFLHAWKNSTPNLQVHLTWNLEQLEARKLQLEANPGVMQSMDQVIVFLYRNLISKRFEEEETNEYSIDLYQEVMEEVEDFVFSNIQDLVVLHLQQTDYKFVN
mmetsp:Transcript_33596/g.51709  ORF Transcript_33596/g.51709 Transcript_33596/m.51709 type:complete len:106 (+) Transcript_33596:1533-1850(+)